MYVSGQVVEITLHIEGNFDGGPSICPGLSASADPWTASGEATKEPFAENTVLCCACKGAHGRWNWALTSMDLIDPTISRLSRLLIAYVDETAWDTLRIVLSMSAQLSCLLWKSTTPSALQLTTWNGKWMNLKPPRCMDSRRGCAQFEKRYLHPPFTILCNACFYYYYYHLHIILFDYTSLPVRPDKFQVLVFLMPLHAARWECPTTCGTALKGICMHIALQSQVGFEVL